MALGSPLHVNLRILCSPALAQKELCAGSPAPSSDELTVNTLFLTETGERLFLMLLRPNLLLLSTHHYEYKMKHQIW